MKYPSCSAAELIHDTRDITYTHKGETTVIPAVTGDFCPTCDEFVTDLEETDRVMRQFDNLAQRFPHLKNAHSIYRDFCAGGMRHLLAGISKAQNLRCFAHKDATAPANTSGYLPDLGEFRGKQECYTHQSTAMAERPACSTTDCFAETSRLNADRNNSGLQEK